VPGSFRALVSMQRLKHSGWDAGIPSRIAADPGEFSSTKNIKNKQLFYSENLSMKKVNPKHWVESIRLTVCFFHPIASVAKI
jgi:hypothetical protein